ncbi:MAG: LysE family translocator [Phenylobacterium sp.]|uniref:LysE family translocator n=1 Tax=Phenylobacterium sp. TaxID=1871053 RepID=UPI00391DB252
MSVTAALVAYCAAAALLTITPGLDTALVLRTGAAEGVRRAGFAAAGIVLGCLVWGAAVALGLGALLAASQTAFTVLKWVGAAYLAWLGVNLILKPRRSFTLEGAVTNAGGGDLAWLRRGLLTNLLNPKVGVFYVSFLPQFLPEGVAAGPFMFLLAALHAGMGGLWLGLLTIATRPLARILRRPAAIAWLDRATGGIFLTFAARLALARG